MLDTLVEDIFGVRRDRIRYACERRRNPGNAGSAGCEVSMNKFHSVIYTMQSQLNTAVSIQYVAFCQQAFSRLRSPRQQLFGFAQRLPQVDGLYLSIRQIRQRALAHVKSNLESEYRRVAATSRALSINQPLHAQVSRLR